MKLIPVGDIELALEDRGEGSPVLFLHGFPEFGYSWRHQIGPVADAGYRVLVPDQRGYGASSKPEGVGEYSLNHLVADVIGLLDELRIPDVTLVGHDWGSIVAYAVAFSHPHRVRAIASLNIPHRGVPGGFPPIDFIRERFPERFAYVLMFQEEGVAEAGFAADPEAWLKAFYLGGSNGEEFMTDDEFAVYRDAFVLGGITAPVNWYRNIDANAVAFAHLAHSPLPHPLLMIAADNDPVLPLALTEDIDRWAKRSERVVIENCGHWTQQQHPDQVNAALLEWLGRVA